MEGVTIFILWGGCDYLRKLLLVKVKYVAVARWVRKEWLRIVERYLERIEDSCV